VIGERSSGTNLADKLIRRCLKLEPIPVVEWKHGFPTMTAIPNDTLIVASFRNCMDWARSMHRKPWHATAEVQARGFSEFIRHPWETRAEVKYFKGMVDAAAIDTPIQSDLHPITGKVFENLITLRNAKARAHLGFASRACNFAAIRLEDLHADPKAMIAALASRFDLQVLVDRYDVRRALGSRFHPAVKDRPETPSELSEEDRKFILSQIDPELEAELGYIY